MSSLRAAGRMPPIRHSADTVSQRPSRTGRILQHPVIAGVRHVEVASRIHREAKPADIEPSSRETDLAEG